MKRIHIRAIITVTVIITLICAVALLSACKSDNTGTVTETPGGELPVSSVSNSEPAIAGVSNDALFGSVVWGLYTAVESTSDLSAFTVNMIYEDYPSQSYPDNKKSVLPYWIQVGPYESRNSILYGSAPELDWMVMYFDTTTAEVVNPTVPYRIDGNRILFALDYDSSKLTDSIENITWGHEIFYRFEGRNLVLSRAGAEVVMMPYDFRQTGTGQNISAFLNSGQTPFGGVTHIKFIENDRVSVRQINLENGWRAVDPEIVFADDGILTMSWSQEIANRAGTRDKPTKLTCRYIWGGTGGLILIDDDGNLYTYQMSEQEYRVEQLSNALGDIDITTLSAQEIERLIELQQSMLDDLQSAFDDAQIDAEVDMETGQVMMDNSILFSPDEAVLSDEGKAYLDDFLDAYADVIFSDAYSGSVAQIIVEGHTAPVSTSTDGGKAFSKLRAQAVADYCLLRQPKLAEIIEIKGSGDSNPIYDENGSIDMAASRRVVFIFILNT